MRKSDKKLGMDRSITRRDFVHGVGSLGAATMLAGGLMGCGEAAAPKSSVYPPGFVGLRGNHDGSYGVAHALAREGKADWGPVQDVEDFYDLVVVGAGISGLAAAYLYRRENPDARILLLDNHDDFGGHAKRNEVEVNGRTLLGNGGSDFLANPHGFSEVVKKTLGEIGIDFDRLAQAHDKNFARRHGLSLNYHFNKAAWGETVTVPAGYLSPSSDLTDPSISAEQTIDRFPVSEKAKKELLHIFTAEEDQLPDLSEKEKIAFLSGISYRDFLINNLGATDQDVFDFFQDQTSDIGLGIEATDAYVAMTYALMPGWKATGLPEQGKVYGDTLYKFPDGNATVPRLMVRSLIPAVAPGNTMEGVVTARFDYGRLDQTGSNVRLRLNSTVTSVANDAAENSVKLTYVKDNEAFLVRAKHCVLACNNSIIPYLCPELPAVQKEALANQVRQPLLLNHVAVKNWHAWKEMGLDGIETPGGYHNYINLPAPLNIGDYSYSQNPEEPNFIVMHKCPHVNNEGLNAMEQFRAGRHELLSTPFDVIERHIRAELDELLGGAGFNAAEDIEAIIVNRWAHGYAYTRNFHSLFDQDYEDPNDPRYPHVHARKPFGQISIANSDAGANAMVEEAIEQAHRAVNELRSTE